MKKPGSTGPTLAFLLALVAAVGWRWSTGEGAPSTAGPPVKVAPNPLATDAAPGSNRQPEESQDRPPRAPAAGEKLAQVRRIKRDYDEIRARLATDYGADGAAFPGGVHAFLRQLALLHREQRADFASLLSARECEDLELHESNAGQFVTRVLGATDASDEQRRAVFRLQRDFEEQCGLDLEPTPAGAFERERARQQMEDRIRDVLGDARFEVWLAGADDGYARAAELARKYGLSPTVPRELQRAKNDFTLKRLALNAAQGLSPAEVAADQLGLARQTEFRAVGILGPALDEAARDVLLNWLPRK